MAKHQTFTMRSTKCIRTLCTNTKKLRTPSNSHLTLCHTLWNELLSDHHPKSSSLVIDATCGNGFDSAVLAGLCGQLLCIDVQAKAITATRQRLLSIYGNEMVENQIKFLQQSHETFPPDIQENSVDLIAYNLGYLPGSASDGMNRVVSDANTTIQSLRAALPFVRVGGLITMVAYRGHKGGEEETTAIAELVSQLPVAQWRVCAHIPLNAPTGPVLFSLYKQSLDHHKQTDMK